MRSEDRPKVPLWPERDRPADGGEGAFLTKAPLDCQLVTDSSFQRPIAMPVAAFRRLVRSAFGTVAVSAVALTLVTCTDDPVGPGRGGIAHLRLQPVFDAYSRVAPLALDRVRVVVIRPRTDTLADVSQAFSATATSVRLDVPVRLERTTEDLEVNLELYAGSILLFSGADTARVAAGTSNPVSQIPVRYKGPGANLASFTLGPRDTLVPAGGVFAFTASAVDSQQAPVAQFYLSWSATAGTIDAAGQFTAPALADTVWVRAVTPTQIWDSTRVFVTGLPAALTIASGDGQTGLTGSRLPLPLAVQVRDANNQPVPGVVAAFSVLTGGGSVDSATATTDAQGIARSGATLGPTQGTQTFRAAVGNLPAVTFTATATTLPAPTSVLLAAGDQFTCDIRAGGAAYCWGLNSSGQLGDGTTTNRRVPTPVAGGLTFTSISAGAGHACGVVSGGTVYCWGSNTNGQLGDGTTTGHLTPAPVSGGTSFTAVHAGAGFTCGLSTAGQAFCWGNNGAGNLGDGSTSQRLVPTAVAGGLTFLQLRLFADNHVCALTTAGDVYCWGYNFDGAVGDGTTTNRSVPTLVLGGRTYQAVASAHYHSCALDVAGAAWCWGDNNAGQIGDGGAPTDRLAPVQVQGGHTFTALSGGGAHTCGLTAGGQVYCWGVNGSGQLGNGTTTGSQAPVLVSGAGFTAISTGETHTCGLSGSGARCWGDNSNAQIGDGLTVNQPSPVAVQNPPASVTVQAGNNQVAAPGATVTVPPAVLVRDALNNPLTGVEVTFAVTSGGGSIPGATAITASNGIASVASWTLGSTPGTNTLTATVSAGGVSGNPVTFTATGTTGPTPLTWTGSVNSDWSNAANWTPAQVPSALTDVTIPAGTPSQPTLSANAFTGNLTIQPGGAILDLGTFTLQVGGDLDVNGPITGGIGSKVVMANANSTLQGAAVISPNLEIAAPVLLGSTLSLGGSLTINGGAFSLNGHAMDVSGNLTTTNSGLLYMLNPADVLTVGGNATFDGGNQLGFMTTGVLAIAGNLTQLASNSGDSFHPSGNHITDLIGTNPTISFATPGNAPGTSHFEELEWGGAGTLTLASDVWAHGTLALFGGSPVTIAGTDHALTVGGYTSFSSLTLDGIRLGLDMPVGGALALHDLSFQNMNAAGTQLTVMHTGAGGPLTFTNLAFLTIPTGGGFYLSADDTNQGDLLPLVIDMANPTPATDGGFKQELNGATINWPAASPGLTWNGASDTAWTNPANWTPNGVPTGTTNVIIPSGTPNSPVITTNADVNDLSITGTLTLQIGQLTVNGNLGGGGPIVGAGTVLLAGSGKTVTGVFNQLQVGTNASYTAVGGIGVNSNVTLNGTLTVGGQIVSIQNNLSVFGNGLLVMQNPSDYVFVANQATFGGAASAGFLTNGVLEVQGKFTQTNSTAANSFSASGTHRTTLPGSAFQQVVFSSPGNGASSSHFADLDVSFHTAGLVDFVNANTMVVEGQLIAQPPGGLVQLGTSNGGQLVVGGVNVHDLVLNNLPLTINGGTITEFNRVTFAGFTGGTNGAKTQLTVNHPGAASPFLFDGLTFQDQPTTGRYLVATDTDGGTPNVLTIGLTNPSPATDGGFILAQNGASILWPATGGALSWSGVLSDNWNVAGNWSPNRVPTPLDTVSIAPGGTFSPKLPVSVGVASLTIQPGIALDVDTAVLVVGRSLDASGAINGVQGTGAVVLAGGGQLQGTVNVDLMIAGPYILTGGINALSVSIAGDSGSLVLGPFGLTTTNDFSTLNSGTVTMDDPGSQLVVGGSAFFAGGDETGKLTAGTLQVAGDFDQIGLTSPSSFAASGGHITNLTGLNPTVTFTNPGPAHFSNLFWGGIGGTLTLGSDVTVLNDYSAPDGQAAMAGNGFSFTTGTFFSGGLNADNMPIVIDQPVHGIFTGVFGLTFTNMATTATQLTIRDPGNGNAITLDLVAFDSLSTGATGLYLSVEDTDLNDAIPLSVNLTGATPNDPTNGGADQFYLKVTGTEAIDWNGQVLP